MEIAEFTMLHFICEGAFRSDFIGQNPKQICTDGKQLEFNNNL